jgi:dTDP-4-amino-4,6-dideoxy-D-galactose acyltransferase
MGVKADVIPLAWASELFGRRCARLSFAAGAENLSSEALFPYDIVEAKVAAPDTALADGLVGFGFRLVDTEIDFEWAVAAGTEPEGHVVAVESDIPALRDVAGCSFLVSRFRPPWYSAEEREGLYRVWVENAVLGTHDDTCLLVREKEELLGFVTMRRMTADSARVGLLTAVPGHTRRGVGRRLTQIARRWSADQGVTRLNVATQGANLGAVGFYQAQGATVATISYWMYR